MQAFPVLAQAELGCSYSIRGAVLEKVSGEPILGATVYIPELKKGAVTDVRGKYVIENVCPGLYTVICQHLGHHADSIGIHVHEGPVQHSFTLGEADIQLNAIVVVGEKSTPIVSQPTVELVGIELEKTRGLSLGESLKSLPGVNTIQTGPAISKPVIHGLHGSRVLILNNGIRQEGQQWGAEHAPEIDPLVAKRITVVKGAASVRYGPDAIGGVILVEPAPLPVHAGTQGELNLIGYTNGWGGIVSGQLEGGSKKWDGLGWRLQSTAKRAGDSWAPDYMLSNTGVSELNFSGGLGYRQDKHGLEVFVSHFHTNIGILRSSHIGNLSDLERALKSPRPLYIKDFTYQINNPRQDIDHSLLKISGFTKLPKLGTFYLQYGGQLNSRQEYDIRRGQRSDKSALNLQLFTHTLDALLEHNTLNNFSGSLGISLLFQDNNNIPGTGVIPLIPNYNTYMAGLFATEKWSREKWILEAGLRYDYRYMQVQRFDENQQLVKPDYRFINLSAIAGGIFTPNDRWTFKSNIGTAWRPPNVNELYSQGLHHGLGSIEEGSDSLSPENSIKWINTIQHHGSKLSFEVDLYYQHIGNYIYLEPQAEPRLTIRGAFPVFQYTQTDARLTGADAMMSYHFNDALTFRSKASVVRARDLRKDTYLIFMPADRFNNSLTYQWENLGKVKDAFVTLEVINVRRQNRVPEGVDYADPPAAYMLLGLQAGCVIPVAKNALTIGLNIRNALNVSYRDYLNRTRYYADEIGQNVILRLKYEFGKSQ